MKRFSKQAKSAMAATLAAVLAVPAVSLFGSSTVARAAEEYPADLPMPIQVYDFESEDGLTISAVDNPAVIENDEERGSKVVKLQDAVPVEITTGAGTFIDYNINSSIQIDNPFVGREDVYERDPAGYLKSEDENTNGAPIWEKGVTISYWQKTSGLGEESEGSVLAFNSHFDDAVQADDMDKMRIAELYKENPDDPIFRFDEAYELTPANYQEYELNGLKIEGTLRGNRKIHVDFGLLAPFNPNYEKEYYLKLNNAGDAYQLPVSLEGYKTDVNAYMTVTGDATKVKIYEEEGSLSFKSSGAWGFFESGDSADYYINGVYDSHVNSSPTRNHAFAYAYTIPENGTEKTYEPVESLGEALVENSEWHYITYVVQNDHVNLYVDGELQYELFTNGSSSANVDANKRFNKGWGYYDTATNIINKQGGMDIFKFATSIATPIDGNYDVQYDENGDYILGYNGNTNMKTIMEVLTDENTTLWIGEDGNSTNSLHRDGNNVVDKYTYNLKYGTKAGTMLDDLAFFAEPMSEDQVAALYEYVSAGNTPEVPKEDDPSNPTTDLPKDSDQPNKTDDPDSTEPVVMDTPDPHPTQIPNTNDPAVTETTAPTQAPSNVLLGDADLNGKIELNDANVVLKAALGIGAPLTGDAFIAADVNKDGEIKLDDANKVLRVALGIDKMETAALAAKLGL